MKLNMPIIHPIKNKKINCIIFLFNFGNNINEINNIPTPAKKNTKKL